MSKPNVEVIKEDPDNPSSEESESQEHGAFSVIADLSTSRCLNNSHIAAKPLNIMDRMAQTK